MSRILASTLVLAAVTFVALPQAPKAMNSRSAGHAQLSADELDQITAGSQSCDSAGICVRNDQQSSSGTNIGGSTVVILGKDEVVIILEGVPCAAGICVQNNQQSSSGTNIDADAVIHLD